MRILLSLSNHTFAVCCLSQLQSLNQSGEMSRDHPSVSRQSVAITRPVNTVPRTFGRIIPSSAASSQTSSTPIAHDPADTLTDGISGSAMSVPPPKALTLAPRPENVKSNSSPRKAVTTSKSDPAASDVKLSKEVSDRNREQKEALVRITNYDLNE
jgi:hypothetical protein